jgi:hypothetical protein
MKKINWKKVLGFVLMAIPASIFLYGLSQIPSILELLLEIIVVVILGFMIIFGCALFKGEL